MLFFNLPFRSLLASLFEGAKDAMRFYGVLNPNLHFSIENLVPM